MLRSKRQQVIADLKKAISDEIKPTRDLTSGKKTKLKAKEKASEEEKIKAGKIILRFWRTSQIVKNMYRINGYKTYVDMLLPFDEKVDIDEEINALSKLMFGRTIAAIHSDPEFPFLNPNMHSSAAYHRDDDLTSEFMNKILVDFEPLSDQEKFTYIPISILESTPIENILETYLSQYKKSITLLKDDKSQIAFLKIAKNDLTYETIISKIKATGIIASPWQLANYYVQLKKEVDKKEGQLSSQAPMFYLNSPEDMKSFLSDKCMDELSSLASSKRPTKYLAQSIANMLGLLKDIDIDKNLMQRIYIFLNIGLKFYKNNYIRFSMITYGIVHEITILICKNKKLEEVMTYSNFKRDAEWHAISSFQMESKDSLDDRKYQPIAFPANTGTNAYIIAMNLAKKMKIKEVKPTIRVVGPMYYEFKEMDETTFDENADIYVASTGPIIINDTKSPTAEIQAGIDINKLIRKRMALIPKKPFTVVIDSTSGLYKNLILDKNIQKYINEGSLSIIIFESHQKFGLLHTDQAQFGRVFGICSKEYFSADVIKEFEKKAAADIKNVPDMAIGSFINIACGEILEKIKEKHFANGDIFRRVFAKLQETFTVSLYEDTLDSSKELFFNFYPDESELGKAAQYHLSSRDSFAHFKTTSIEFPGSVRISANASDEFDILVEAGQLYLLSLYRNEPAVILQNFLKDYLIPFDSDKNISLHDEIILFSITSILGKNLISSKESDLDKFTLMSQLNSFISTRDDSVIGRKCFNHLFRAFQANLDLTLGCGITVQDIFNHLEYLKISNKNNKEFMDELMLYLGIPVEKIDAKNSHAVKLILQMKKLTDLNFQTDEKSGRQLKESGHESKESHLSFEDKSHALLCKAILCLNKISLLNEEILAKLISDSKVANAVIQLSDKNLLNKSNLRLLCREDDKARAFIILISANVLDEEAFDILKGRNKELKDNDRFVKAIENVSSSNLINKTMISYLINHPDDCKHFEGPIATRPEYLPLKILSRLPEKECLKDLKKWSPDKVRQFYHFIQDNAEAIREIPPPVLKNIINCCNIVFSEAFYKIYAAKYISFLSFGKSAFVKKLKNREINDIALIESSVKESKNVDEILNKWMKL